MTRASCHFGAVAFSVAGPLRSVLTCHCGPCRTTSGQYKAATSVPDDAITFEVEDGRRWFRASDTASREFCIVYESTLFWKPVQQQRTVISARAYEDGPGLKLGQHVFCEVKGDHSGIMDGMSQYERFWGG